MCSKNRSKIWEISDKEFIELVNSSIRWKDILNYFGLTNKGNNHHTLKKRVKLLNINTDHILNRIDSSSFKRRISKEDFY